MYAKTKDSQLVQFPYGFSEMQAENPYTNFGGADFESAFGSTEAAQGGAVLQPIVMQATPDHDQKTQRVVHADQPSLVESVWTLTCTVVNKAAEELAQQDAEQAKAVRAERNSRLKSSDWTQVADAPVDQTAWAAYRQALRDISAQAGFPWTIDWPVAP